MAVVWTWSPKKVTAMRTNRGDKTTLHGRLLEVDTKDKLTFHGDFSDSVGLVFSHQLGKCIEDESIQKDWRKCI